MQSGGHVRSRLVYRSYIPDWREERDSQSPWTVSHRKWGEIRVWGATSPDVSLLLTCHSHQTFCIIQNIYFDWLVALFWASRSILVFMFLFLLSLTMLMCLSRLVNSIYNAVYIIICISNGRPLHTRSCFPASLFTERRWNVGQTSLFYYFRILNMIRNLLNCIFLLHCFTPLVLYISLFVVYRYDVRPLED